MECGGRVAARWRLGRAILLGLLVSAATTRGRVLAEDAPDEHHRGGHDVLPGEGFSPRFDLHGFSDITFSADRVSPPGGGSSSGSRFALGQLDLYMVSRLSSQVLFLG